MLIDDRIIKMIIFYFSFFLPNSGSILRVAETI